MELGNDPFKEFDGSVVTGNPASAKPVPSYVNPFQEFGGKPVPINSPVVTADPFKQFDGQKVKESTIHTSAKQWLSNYMDSPMYKQRLANFSAPVPSTQGMLNTPIVYKDGGMSGYEQYSNGKDAINIDNKEIADLKNRFGRTDNPNDILAHELSHRSRMVTPKEAEFIGSKNISTVGEPLFGMWKTDRDIHGSSGNYNDYMNPHKDGWDDQYHDYRPYENKADLDALRFMMYKKGIYDTSKRAMTIDDFNKAMQDKDIKNSLMFNRLLEQFKPGDIVNLNNVIASNHDTSDVESRIAPLT